MASQSITNKLVANIRQANDISKNFFTGTNVVCIDTSNRRLGIDTKTPTWSIDISGIEPYNGVKCHNLDISGRADISYALIKNLIAPTISADDANISFIYVNEISGNLIDISEVIFNSISGDFIYSNNTIIGNFIGCDSAQIENDLDIKGTLTVQNFTFEKEVSFNEVTIDLSLTTQSTCNSLFQGNVDFSNINPVTYITLSGNHINTFSLSCENLQVNQQADFSSINVSSEASFNTINVSGDAIFSSISAESITIIGEQLSNFISQQAANDLNFDKDISLNTIVAKKLYIEDTNNNDINNNYLDFKNNKPNTSFIDNLIINNELDLSNNNIGTSLILPYKRPGDNKIGNIYYSITDNGVIDGIEIIKSKTDNSVIRDTDIIKLKQLLTDSYMLKESGEGFQDFANYKCVKMTTHDKSQIRDKVFDDSSDYLANINAIQTDIIEINANITLSLNNDNNGNDVDALNYEFCIFGLESTDIPSNIDDISEENKFVSNKNTILVFDNSYNYNSTTLHFIGEKKNFNRIVFGISYENASGKDLSLNLEYFNTSIKSVN